MDWVILVLRELLLRLLFIFNSSLKRMVGEISVNLRSTNSDVAAVEDEAAR